MVKVYWCWTLIKDYSRSTPLQVRGQNATRKSAMGQNTNSVSLVNVSGEEFKSNNVEGQLFEGS